MIRQEEISNMKKKILSLTLCTALLGGMSTSVCAAAEDYSEDEIHTIGVAMYDPDSAEMESRRLLSRLYRRRISCKIIFPERSQMLSQNVILLKRQRKTEQKESFHSLGSQMDFRMS